MSISSLSVVLNIHFLENKFELLKQLIKNNIDILLISETKLTEGYSEPIKLDRNSHGGGIIFFIQDDLPNKELKSQITQQYRRYFY